MAIFAERLRAARLSGGWSRRVLAEAAGISEGSIRDYEKGKRHPTLDAALRLAIALGKDATYWADCVGGGAYPLPPGKPRANALQFGQYKGHLLSEVPLSYLQWLARERPRGLTPTQTQTVERLLAAHQQRQAREHDQRRASHIEIRRERAETARLRAESERLQAEARQTQAEAERLAEENRRRELVGARRQRLAEELQPAPPAKPTRPRMDDALPWESADKPPQPPGES